LFLFLKSFASYQILKYRDYTDKMSIAAIITDRLRSRLHTDNSKEKIFIFLFTILSSCFFLTLFYYSLLHIPGYKKTILYLSFAMPVLTAIILRKSLNRYDIIVILYVLLIIVWSSFTQGFSITGYRWYKISICMLCAGIITAKGKYPSWAVKFIFLVMAGTTIYYMLASNYNPPKSMRLLYMNRNVISMYMFGYAAWLYFADYIEGRKRPLVWPASIALIISTFSMSRTGTLIALMLFTIVLLFNSLYTYNKFIKKRNNDKTKKLYSLAALSIIILLIIIICYTVYDLSRFSTVDIANKSTIDRLKIYKSFFNELNYQKALLGFKYSFSGFKTPLKHLHNSYLHLFSWVGAASVPVFIFLIYTAYKYFKESFFIFSIYMLLMLYSMPELVKFGRNFDFLLYTFIFYHLSKKPPNK